MTTTVDESSTTAFKVRSGRNIFALVVLIPLTAVALWVGADQARPLGFEDWWIGVFPTLTAAGMYRLVRPRAPLVLDRHGLRVATGHRLLGLRTAVEWKQVKRMRIIAAGLLLIELHDAQRWAADKPWLVRANVRANERKFSAAIVQPLRELTGTSGQILARLRAAAPVRVDAPEGMREQP